MSVDPSEPAWGPGAPAADWLALVNRQSLAVRLLATTVHDVNNILQVMSGAAEVLALDPTPAAVARRTTSIVGQSAAATGVLHALTGFIRADSAAADGARPMALAQQAVAFRQHALRKHRLTATVTGDDVECTMARHRLQQVLLNLVINAEQALTGRLGGAIQIAVSGADAVTIVVEDDGPGIPADRLRSLFAWPPAPGPGAGALGIGLLVSRVLVEAAGGTLAVESASGGGARVVLTLPPLLRG